MTKVCFIRHGETDWNKAGILQGQEDIELNDKGKAQAEITGKYVKQLANWDAIISSPLSRAFKTAEIINAHINLPQIITMKDFIERDFGEASGLKREAIPDYFPDGIVPGQESREQLRERTMRGLEKLRENYKDKQIIVVSHGGVINYMLSILSDGEIGSGKTRLDNVSLNQLSYDGGKWQIDYYNFTDHLKNFSFD